LKTADAESLAARVTAKFGIAATTDGNKVRMERKEGHRFVTDLVESFPGEVQSISVSKPTLEDVFIPSEPAIVSGGRKISSRERRKANDHSTRHRPYAIAQGQSSAARLSRCGGAKIVRFLSPAPRASRA